MASSGSKVAGVLIAATIAMTLFSPLSGAVMDNTGTTHVTNETLSAQPGEFQELDGYDIVSDSETVSWQNGSSWETLGASSYQMDDEAGSIMIENSSSVSDGDSIRVSYDYQATSGTTTTIVQLVPLFAGLLVLGVLANNVTNRM